MKTVIMLFALSMISTTGFTQEGTKQAQEETNKKEGWYTYWGLGYAATQYPGDLQSALDALDNVPGASRVRLSLDMFGFYWPVNNHHTAVGVVINGAADRFIYQAVLFQVEWFQINQYTLAASTMHYFNNTIGKGFFVRGDVGIAKLAVSDSDGNNDSSNNGIGFLVGGGYGFNLSPGTRLLINVNYGYRKVEGDATGVIGISVGGMF